MAFDDEEGSMASIESDDDDSSFHDVRQLGGHSLAPVINVEDPNQLVTIQLVETEMIWMLELASNYCDLGGNEEMEVKMANLRYSEVFCVFQVAIMIQGAMLCILT